MPALEAGYQDRGGRIMNKARTTAFLAAFTAAAVIFSYAETLFPPLIPISGFKLGFSNIAILCVLYLFGTKAAFAVLTVRSVISAAAFSGVVPLILSLSGGILAATAMWLAKKSDKLSIFGVSVIGATLHNIGQCAAAAILLQPTSVFAYLPLLMILSVICGAGVGLVSAAIMKILKRSKLFS